MVNPVDYIVTSSIQMFLLLLILSLSISLNSGAHTIDAKKPTTVHLIRSNITKKSFNVTDTIRLSYVKLSLAGAFFFGVLLCCGLPILFINYLQKTSQYAERTHQHAKRHIEKQRQRRLRKREQRRQHESASYEQHREKPTTSWCHSSDTKGRIYVESESLSIPGPNLNLQESIDRSEYRELLQIADDDNDGTHEIPQQDRIETSNTEHVLRTETTEEQPQEQLFSRRNILTTSPDSPKNRRVKLLQKWFSRCNCFAAGVFLSSGFMELYPDVEEAIEEAKSVLTLNTNFPFAPFFALVGFFLVLSIEQFVWIIKLKGCSLCSARSYLCFSCCFARRVSTVSAEPLRLSLTSSSPPSSPGRIMLGSTNLDGFDNSVPDSNHKQLIDARDTFTNNPSFTSHRNSLYTDIDPSPLMDSCLPNSSSPSLADQYFNNHLNNKQDTAFNLVDSTHASSHDHQLNHFEFNEGLSFGSLMGVILLLCAMSVHSVFEGLAVGLQLTIQRTLALFSAILLHKLIIALGIGVNLATHLRKDSTSTVDLLDSIRTNSTNHASQINNDTDVECHNQSLNNPKNNLPKHGKFSQVCYYQLFATIVFASASPFGIFIGWLMLNGDQHTGTLILSTALLQGLACGTFFYVVFCELLPAEFNSHNGKVSDRMGKLFILISGFLLVTFYSYFMAE